MKKIFATIIIIIVASITATAQKMSYGKNIAYHSRLFEFSGTLGSVYGGGGIVDFDFSLGGVWAGIGWGYTNGDGTTVYVESPKTVHVKGYTKKDGTYVHGYDRAAPGKGGGYYTNAKASNITEYYLGYWLPCAHSNSIDFCAAPVIGSWKEERSDNGDWLVNQKAMYGVGMKFVVKEVGMGMTIRITNTCLVFGFLGSLGWHFRSRY